MYWVLLGERKKEEKLIMTNTGDKFFGYKNLEFDI